jgi:hypothetical protein
MLGLRYVFEHNIQERFKMTEIYKGIRDKRRDSNILDSLIADLESLHAPIPADNWGTNKEICEHCTDNYGLKAAFYPCPTIRIVQKQKNRIRV